MTDSNVSRKSRESDCTLVNILYLVCCVKSYSMTNHCQVYCKDHHAVPSLWRTWKMASEFLCTFWTGRGTLWFFFPLFFFAFKSLSCSWANRCRGPNYASSYNCSCYSDLSRVISNTTKNGKFQVSRVPPDIFSFPSIQSKHENVHWYQPCSSSWLTEDGSPASTVRNCPLCLSSAYQPWYIMNLPSGSEILAS